MNISTKTEVFIEMTGEEAQAVKKLIGKLSIHDMRNIDLNDNQIDFLVDVLYAGLRDTLKE